MNEFVMQAPHVSASLIEVVVEGRANMPVDAHLLSELESLAARCRRPSPPRRRGERRASGGQGAPRGRARGSGEERAEAEPCPHAKRCAGYLRRRCSRWREC